MPDLMPNDAEAQKRLISKIDALVEAVHKSDLDRQRLHSSLEMMSKTLADHGAREEGYWAKIEAMQTDLSRRVSILEVAQAQATGARSAVEFILRYGWVLVVGALGIAYHYLSGGPKS